MVVKILAALTLLSGLALSTADPSDAATTATVYGNPAAGIADWHLQHYGDCGEMAAEVVIHEETGVTLSETRIDAYALKSGAMPNGLSGGTYITSIPSILGHYGVKSTEAPHSLTTIEADLKAGNRVIAYVDAGMIWNADLPALAAYGYPAQPDNGTPTHLLVLDSINTTAGTATLTDSGGPWGADEVVPLSVFKASWATGFYTTIVATGATK